MLGGLYWVPPSNGNYHVYPVFRFAFVSIACSFVIVVVALVVVGFAGGGGRIADGR